jgi:radical SAM protein with 4Fe4S-binding SPASM domain
MMKNKFDVNKSPWTTIWETTQACDVVCLDYGDGIQSDLDPLELSTEEAEQMIAQVADLQPRIFMFNGADPLKRHDIYHLVECAARRHLHPIMAVRATPLLTFDAVSQLKAAGLSRLVFRLDGSTPELHDVINGVHGSFARTLEATQWAEECRLPFQVTTRVCQRNLDDLEHMALLLKPFRVAQWNVEFVVPKREAQMEEMPSPGQFEEAFARLYKLAQKVPFKIKTTEAPHYRRYVLQQQTAARANGPMHPPQFEEGIPGILPVNEERATIFISHTGEVYPCASLPITAGNIRIQKLKEIYRGAKVLVALRDVASLKGKCGVCAFKQVCGGSRARAYAVNANAFAEDPSCIYRPMQPERIRAGSPSLLPPEKAVVDPGH